MSWLKAFFGFDYRSLGNDVLEDISKPLRVLSDQQKEARKPVGGKAFWEACQTSKMESFAKICSGF